MGRKPLGSRVMTALERQHKRRARLSYDKEKEIVELIAKSIYEGKTDRKWKDADDAEVLAFRHTAILALRPVKIFFKKGTR